MLLSTGVQKFIEWVIRKFSFPRKYSLAVGNRAGQEVFYLKAQKCRRVWQCMLLNITTETRVGQGNQTSGSNTPGPICDVCWVHSPAGFPLPSPRWTWWLDGGQWRKKAVSSQKRVPVWTYLYKILGKDKVCLFLWAGDKGWRAKVQPNNKNRWRWEHTTKKRDAALRRDWKRTAGKVAADQCNRETLKAKEITKRQIYSTAEVLRDDRKRWLHYPEFIYYHIMKRHNVHLHIHSTYTSNYFLL